MTTVRIMEPVPIFEMADFKLIKCHSLTCVASPWLKGNKNLNTIECHGNTRSEPGVMCYSPQSRQSIHVSSEKGIGLLLCVLSWTPCCALLHQLVHCRFLGFGLKGVGCLLLKRVASRWNTWACRTT